MSTPLIELKPAICLAASQEPAPPPPSSADLGRPVTDTSRPRILYAEDEDSLRRLGEMLLLRSGYAVDVVTDGAEAWTALQHTNYDLIITNDELPHFTGQDLVRKSRLAGINAPTISLTSGALETLPLNDIAWLECAAMLAKPFSCGQLLQVVREALRAAATKPPACAIPQPVGDQPPLPMPPHTIRRGINE